MVGWALDMLCLLGDQSDSALVAFSWDNSDSLPVMDLIWNPDGGRASPTLNDIIVVLMRARARLMLFNFEKELFIHVHTLENDKSKASEKIQDKARAEIRDRLTTLAPLFLKNKYMLGDEFSMLDVAVAPLLWRLDHYGIRLGKPAAPLMV